MYKNKSLDLPIILQSRDMDTQLIEHLNQNTFTSNVPIIWHNINMGSSNRITQQSAYFKNNINHYFSFNSLITNNFNEKLKHLNDIQTTDRIILESDSPHNAPHFKHTNKSNQKIFKFAIPLHIASTIIHLHYQIIRYPNFKNFTLIDTNNLIFNNTIQIFRNKNNINYNINTYKFQAYKIVQPFLDKWKSQLKYHNPIQQQQINLIEKHTNTPSTTNSSATNTEHTNKIDFSHQANLDSNIKIQQDKTTSTEDLFQYISNTLPDKKTQKYSTNTLTPVLSSTIKQHALYNTTKMNKSKSGIETNTPKLPITPYSQKTMDFYYQHPSPEIPSLKEMGLDSSSDISADFSNSKNNRITNEILIKHLL
jgi:hypothetical protein